MPRQASFVTGATIRLSRRTAGVTYIVKAVCPDLARGFDEGFSAGFQRVWNGAFGHGFNAGFHAGHRRGFHVGFGRAGDVSAWAVASQAL